MRNLLMALMLVLAFSACSGDGITPPSDSDSTPAARLWVGESACEVGRRRDPPLVAVPETRRQLVRVEVQATGPTGVASPLPTIAIVRITIDGLLHSNGPGRRFRTIGGGEFQPGERQFADRLEVFTGLGGNCAWVAVQRVR